MKLKMGSNTKTPEAAATAAQTDKAPGWLKVGGEAQDVIQEQGEKSVQFAGINEKRASLVSEFWLKADETGRVTFLSGEYSSDPDETGKLNYVAVNLHNMRHPKFANRFDNYVCLADTPEGCPFCEAGDSPRWHAVFPIIDHRPIQTKKGLQQNVVRLYLAKNQALKKLHLRAQKLGGIAFQTFDITRTGAKVAREGDEIEHVGEAPKAAIAKKLPNVQLDFDLDWYQKALPFFTREEITLMGFTGEGQASGPVASMEPTSGAGFSLGQSGAGAPLGAGLDDGDDLPF